MRILITGASGFIGQYLARLLRAEHDLLLVSRQPELTARQLAVDNSKVIQLEQLNSLNNVDAIINLAGESLATKRWSIEQKRRISESRWVITAELLEKLKQSTPAPRVWINASAIGFYGAHGTEPLDESYIPSHGDFPYRVCAHWEELAQQASDYHCRVCIMRIGLVLGRQGGALAKMLPAYWLGLGGPLGSGKQMVSWITRADLADAIRFLLEHPECQGVYNATSPHPVNNETFSATLAAVLHRPHFLRTPGWLLKILLGEMAGLLLTGQNVQPKRLLEAGFQFRYPELSEAMRHVLED
ncbi:TIGR01777 family oxidoreductase [Tolumonas osonensis]|uniref:TIGR01777 family protein n=1 Tax=Tolumonas osonensis TaxID=675874 RepID=A0A841GML9_9GAMM|nr:TIGR01777 family oxidoreductase [Tolumonas osonensis]MBB6056371.1 hypothetical protein [Tolumonas osonensis]